MAAFPKRTWKMGFAAISFLVFAVALVSAGANYGLPEVPAVVIPANNLNLLEASPAIPPRLRTDISPNKYSQHYATFPGSYWEYPVYRGVVSYQTAPAAPNPGDALKLPVSPDLIRR